MTPAEALDKVVAAVEAEGLRLRAEFYAPQGPRGRRGSCPADREIEERLQVALQALIPARFCGEECSATPGTLDGWVWLVDPHDGTFEFTAGRRGSAVSVALLRNGEPVLGVVHAPDAPDCGADTIAWAEGAGPLRRNGRPMDINLAAENPVPGKLVWATASAAQRPGMWSRAVLPARYVAMPSIAYRLARVAAGDGIATVSIHAVHEYDIAAGMALVRAAGGTLVDAQGTEIRLEGNPERRVTGCFAGAPRAVQQLAKFDWTLLDTEPRREPRVPLGFPRSDDARLARAQGALLGQVIGDSLGSRVEMKPAAEIAERFPGGVRELGDGGVYHTMAGQPTDDSEMALALARSILRERKYDAERVLDGYRAWLTSRPVDVGVTTERGLLGLNTTESESNGSLMRVSPIGIWAAGDPALAARTARDDSALTHTGAACLEACAAYCAAIAAGIGGADREGMIEAALAHAKGPAHEAVKRAAKGIAPPDYFTHMGWVLVALQNAFWCLKHLEFEEALVETVGRGGDTDTNAAIAGALLGALHGRSAIPRRWILPVLACRPLPEAGALRPRPVEYWPDDVLELAEALLLIR
ncbi:MAG TPA: inositol monophosphatase family protein [Burkholderiales bacterium]|nr:inositol monophosphatase family protein [Burkholderiales bacterium]